MPHALSFIPQKQRAHSTPSRRISSNGLLDRIAHLALLAAHQRSVPLAQRALVFGGTQFPPSASVNRHQQSL